MKPFNYAVKCSTTPGTRQEPRRTRRAVVAVHVLDPADRDLEDPGELEVPTSSSSSGSACRDCPAPVQSQRDSLRGGRSGASPPAGGAARDQYRRLRRHQRQARTSSPRQIGSVTQNGTTSGTWGWSLPTTHGLAGPVSGDTITATDAEGGTKTTTFTYSVTQRPATAVTGNAQVGKNTPYTLQLCAAT